MKYSIEENFKKLEDLTRELESGNLDLEKSIPKFKEGLVLAKELKKKLLELKNEIEEIHP